MVVPVLFLDVDGVLCPLGEKHSGDPHEHVHGPASVGRAWGLWVCWDAETVDRLGRLVQAAALEVRWLTSWGQAAASDLAPVLGLPDFEVVRLDASLATRARWAKAAALEHALADTPGRPYIWVDDDLTGARRKLAPPAQRRLLITPATNVGLTRAHLTQIENFADAS